MEDINSPHFLRAFTPQQSDWFQTEVDYQGIGRAEFISPKGYVEGAISLHFDECGNANIVMQVTRFEAEQHLDFGLLQLLSGSQVVRSEGRLVMGIGALTNNHCTSLVVATDSGNLYMLDEDLHYSYSEFNEETIQFYPIKVIFTSLGEHKAAYWVVPLLNFLSDFRQKNPDLNQHPLRIFPTPIISEDLEGEDRLNAIWTANSRNNLIVFGATETAGFIEPLPDYEERQDKLLNGHAYCAMTAVMVGRLDTSPSDLNDLRRWPPYEYLRALSLATGTEVGAPWLEFRSENGKLVQRFHARLDARRFARGHRTIEENLYLGTGRLLTNALSSTEFGKSYLRVTLKHLTQSGYEHLSLEDKLTHLFRALDCLCDEHGLYAPLKPGDYLPPEQAELLDRAVENAMTVIEEVKKSSAVDDRRGKALSKVANQLKYALNVKPGFGKAVLSLLEKYSLKDAEIINSYYKVTPRSDKRKWEEVLSYYRGITMHRSYFDFDNGSADIWDVVRFVDHLHDILTRIVLIILGYDGNYQPAVRHYLSDSQVNWVQDGTKPGELGY